MNYNEIKLRSRALRKNQTPAEKKLWKRIRNRQLDGHKFLRQHPLMFDRNGNDLKVFIPDFYCPKKRLIIELDGKIHLKTRDRDRWRDEILSEMRCTVLRFKNEELDDIEDVLERILEKLKSL